MGIPHQAFNCKFIMICTIIILSHLSVIKVANAYNSLFIVEDITVDVTAKNSVLAQERAFEQAQSKAFMALTKRMVEEAQVQNITPPSSATISSLVKDYEVKNEKLSAVRYVGTYIFRFREKAVSQFFSISGVNFTNESSKPLLVLPIFQNGGRNILWSDGNIWMKAWANSRSISSGLVPIEVPIGDLMDIADIDENQPLRYSRKNLDRMLARYNAKEAAIMIAVPAPDLLNGGDLRISIYRTDRMSAQHVRDIIIPANNGEDLEQIYARGVKKAYSALQKDWKSKTLSSSSQSKIFNIRVSLKNLRQLVRLKQKLNNIRGISDVFVLSLKKIEAKISLKFRGDEEHLRKSLARANLSLGQEYPSDHSNNIIYDLTFARKPVSYQNIQPAAGTNNPDNFKF